jgi:4-hydroxymandelate oxidase
MDDRLDWARIDWLREITRLPVVLKGVLHPADARLAVEHGVDAVLVSNHGGRQLDGVPASIDALPAVVNAVEGRVPVLLDGGIRRGTDILTALALGAVAVGIGRPVIWGLAARGEAGVRQVLDWLRADLARAMTLAGAVRPADLTPDLILPAVAG